MCADLIGFGLATLDHLMLVESFSQTAGEMRVKDFSVQGGGLVGSALVAASRLGVKTELWTTLGSGRIGEWIMAGLGEEGVGLSRVRRTDEGDGPLILVFVDGRTGERRFQGGAWPKAKDPYPLELDRLDAARCLLVDGSRPDEAPIAARHAREAGVPVVADLSGVDGRQRAIAENVDYLVVDENCARRAAGAGDWESACGALMELGPRAVVLTLGAEGCVYADGSGIRSRPAFEVDVVDTTGAGDCFHGAFCAGLIKGLDLEGTVELASAAASINCRSLGGRAGLPTTDEVEAFLKERNR